MFTFVTLHSQGIVDRLTSTQSLGEGEISIRQSDKIRQLIGRPLESTSESAAFITTLGYRIQCFSGNKQRLSKDEAFEKERKIKEQFSDYPTYITYNSPFWKLRLGDFKTFEEADEILRGMRKAFPEFSKEMFIVKEEIKILLH